MTDELASKVGPYWSAEGVAPDEACWRLARFLYETMEHLDPSAEKGWAELDPHDRDFYHAVICALLDVEGLLTVALAGERQRLRSK